jgi:hypothetical protein
MRVFLALLILSPVSALAAPAPIAPMLPGLPIVEPDKPAPRGCEIRHCPRET